MKADQKKASKHRTRRTLKVQDIEARGVDIKGGSADRTGEQFQNKTAGEAGAAKCGTT